MENQLIQKLKDTVAKSQNVGVVVGKEPTLDQMAAALSLYLFLKEARKNVVVAAPEDPIVEISSLVGINKVQRSLGGESGDLVVSFPYQEEGEIEKVSYTIENNYLNIIVKAGEKGLSFDERDVRYSKGTGGPVDLLFVVGTPRLSDLGDLYDTEKFRDTRIVNIDITERNQGYGDIVLISPEYSSLSEIVTDIGLILGYQMDQDIAQNLMSGIISATNNFQDSNTSPIAFEMASLLMKNGATRGRQSQSGRQEERAVPSFEQRPPAPRRAAPVQQDEEEERPQRVERPRPVREVKSHEDRVREELQQHQTGNQQQPVDDDNAPADWLTPKVYTGKNNSEN